MLRSTESFRTVWSESVYPVIQAEYDALVREVPSRLQAKLERKEKKEKKENKEKKAKKEKTKKKEKKENK